VDERFHRLLHLSPLGRHHLRSSEAIGPSEGPIASLDRKVVPPKRAEMKQSMEALIHHFKLTLRASTSPPARCTSRPKAPGRVRVYLVSDGSNKPYRVKIRPTAFSHLQAMDFMTKGHMLADATAISARWTSSSASATGDDESFDGGFYLELLLTWLKPLA
jgi:NADH:ubiquinone oxidoreductase subunit D